jgi:HK97 family phage major capsid protein
MHSKCLSKGRKLSTKTQDQAEYNKLLGDMELIQTEMQALNAHSKLTPAQQARFTLINGEFRTLEDTAAALKRRMDLDNVRSAMANDPRIQVVRGTPEGGTTAVSRRDRPDSLSRGQSIVDWGFRNSAPGFNAENESLSFDKIIRGLATGDWRNAELEQRAISESPTTAGGHMVPTPVASDVIDKARNASAVFAAGATVVPMLAQTLKYPRLTTEAAPAWRNEAASISDQAMVFDAVTLTARSLAVLVKCSWELLEDATAATNDTVANSFAQVIALELDRVALRGTGSAPEPRGVLNQTGVTLTAHGANGTVISNYDWWLDALGTVRNNNFEPNAQIQAPRSETSLSKLKEATTNAYMRPPAALDNMPRFNSKQVPINLTVGTSTDCSELYTADWSQMLVGIRTDLTIRFLQERFADTGEFGFLAYLRADIQLAQPTAFNVDTGVRA